MTATLVVSVVPAESRPDSRWSVILRVRPARGRTIERPMSVRTPETVTVPAGEVGVEAIFSSGRVEARMYSVADGQVVPISIDVPRSPHETMQSLNLSRDAAAPVLPRTRSARSSARRLVRAAPVGLTPPAAPATTEASIAFAPIARGAPATVTVELDHTYGEGRVIHLLDLRPVNVFRDGGGSALELLRITHPALPGAARVCALPGPLGLDRPPPGRKQHVALRMVEGDLLPDVQITPADEDVAAVVGFLERGDQRALGVLGEGLVSWAIAAMDEKRSDPVVATIGLAVLLRLGQQDAVRGWSANLWKWFPALPDGGALHAAVLLQQSATDVPAWQRELRSAVLGAARAGIPMLSDSLRHLRSALFELRQADERDPEVEAAASWCDRLVRSMDADAVFTTVTLDTVDLNTVWGVNA